MRCTLQGWIPIASRLVSRLLECDIFSYADPCQRPFDSTSVIIAPFTLARTANNCGHIVSYDRDEYNQNIHDGGGIRGPLDHCAGVAPVPPPPRPSASVNQQPRVKVLGTSRPIEMHDSIRIEDLTTTEGRDLIKGRATAALILIGGNRGGRPHLTTGKHDNALRVTGDSMARSLGAARRTDGGGEPNAAADRPPACGKFRPG
jgi:hypothetical protein